MTVSELPVFYYAQGTSNLFNLGSDWKMGYGPVSTWIKGLDGSFNYWDAFVDDPFPRMLDSNLWQWKRVPYPAAALFIGPSIEWGVDWIIADIKSRPIGTPFALGGYSQGAAVMSRIYNECRQGRLADRRHDLRAMVTFGNPMREQGHTFPGSSGFSGACDVEGDTRTGHGGFPSMESMDWRDPFVSRFARLQNTEEFVWEFTMPNEPVGCIGNGPDGLRAEYIIKEGLRLLPVIGAIFAYELMFGIWTKLGEGEPGKPKRIIGVDQNSDGGVLFPDPKTGVVAYHPGGGHVLYPWFPPPDTNGHIPSSGDTCYQIAAKYLNRVGAAIYDEQHPTVPAPTIPAGYQWFSSLPSG